MRASYAALSLASWFIGLLPLRAREAFGAALGFLAGSLLRIRRHVVEGAMTQAGVASPSSTADAMYRQLGRGLVELLYLFSAGERARADALSRVAIEEAATRALDAALALGPVVLFASHTGNWELTAAAAAQLLHGRARRLAVVAKPMSSRGVDAFVARLRRRLGIDIIPPHGALAAARRELGAGNVIVLPIDQVPDRHEHALPVAYLGETAFVDRAPATLAWRASATVLVVATEYTATGTRVRLLDVIAPPARACSKAWIQETTMRATAALESFVRESPDAWLWLHRRWRTPRAGRAQRARLVATAQPG